jgi:hypothetical protein
LRIRHWGFGIDDWGLEQNAVSLSPIKRARFQFHLSTALITMLVAGVLLGLNMRGVPCGHCHQILAIPADDVFRACTFQSHGWPWPCYTHSVRLPRPTENANVLILGDLYQFPDGKQVPINPPVCHAISNVGLSCQALLLDIGVALAMLSAIVCICEWRIRRTRDAA